MRLILIALMFAVTLSAQAVPACGRTVINPSTGRFDCIGGGSTGPVGGASTLTTVGNIPIVTAAGILGTSRLNCALGVCTLEAAAANPSTLIVKATAGQGTTDLVQVKNAAGTTLTYVKSGGGIVVPGEYLQGFIAGQASLQDGLFLGGAKQIFWSADAYFNGPTTVGISKTSTGRAQFNSGTSGQFATLDLGNLVVNSIATPGAPTVTKSCPDGTCASTWSYTAEDLGADGVATTVPGAVGSTTTDQAATLDATHFNTLTGTCSTGATYKRYRRTVSGGTPATLGVIGTVACGTALVDNGLVGDASSAPTRGTMGQVIAGGEISGINFLGSRVGMTLGWVDADTVSVSAGGCVTTGGTALSYAGGNVTFTALDTGTRTLGIDYAMFLTAAGPKLTAIGIYHATGLVPATYTAANTCLLGYFHNGKSIDAANALGAVFQYSVTSNDKLNTTYPFRAVQDLPAGVPLPGMVRVGSVAFGIYEASHEDATASAAGSSAYPASRYGVVPWVSIDGWTTMQVAAQSGLRLPTWAEWLMAAHFNPGSVTPAIMNGNTGSGSSTDGAGYLAEPGAATDDLAGTGAGLLSNGAYLYKVTFVNANGETMGGTASGGVTVADYTTNGKVALSAIPTGAVGTTARDVYRTLVGGTAYKFLVTIADNSTVVYEDNIADATIAGNAAPPTWNTTGVQQATPDPTAGGRTLTGTGPRTSEWATAATRSWYNPAGISDLAGNIWEWVAQFFGGLKEANPGSGVAWGYEGDYAYNFQGQSYNPATGGWTEGLPAMLLVGGGWYNGSRAGVRGAVASVSPEDSYSDVGWRGAR